MSSKIDACYTPHDCYVEVIISLGDIAENKSIEKESATVAKGLLTKFQSYEIAAILIICKNIFSFLDLVTVLLQGKTVDFGVASVPSRQTSESKRW